MAIFKLGRGQLAKGVRLECGWSSHVALHTGRALGAIAGEDALAGIDAGVSLVQGASRGLGLEYEIAFHLPLFFPFNF
jgi:hypothetical protein